MKSKIIEAVVFSIVLPALIGIMAAVFGCKELVISAVVMGVYSLVIHALQIAKEIYY